MFLLAHLLTENDAGSFVTDSDTETLLTDPEVPEPHISVEVLEDSSIVHEINHHGFFRRCLSTWIGKKLLAIFFCVYWAAWLPFVTWFYICFGANYSLFAIAIAIFMPFYYLLLILAKYFQRCCLLIWRFFCRFFFDFV